jgi:hypothetical protein
VSINDERDLRERLDLAFAAIVPGPAPVDGTVRRGKGIRWRRRAAAAAGVAALVAAASVGIPSVVGAVRHSAPSASSYTATVQAPGPHAPAGLIASGTVNGKRWALTADKPGSNGAGPDQQVFASGAAFGSARPAYTGPPLNGGDLYPVNFIVLTGGPTQVQFGAVRADVSYVTVKLGNGTVLTLHPVKVYGGRAVAFAVPLGAPVDDAIGHLTSGSSQAAIPFNEPGGISAFGLWQGNGESGPQRASGRIGSGTFAGHDWSATVYQGPWGVCVIAGGGGTRAIDSLPATGAALGTEVWFWTAGTPAVAVGSAAPRVIRVVVTEPGGKTTRVPLVTVGEGKFFAFPMSPGDRAWKWTAYDASGGVVASSSVTPEMTPERTR